MHYKGLCFKDSAPSALELKTRIKPAVGRVIMPTMLLPDGTWVQDSAVMCDKIDLEHPSPCITPPGAAQQLASLLTELLADEWFALLTLHYRWDIPGNAAWAVQEFGRSAFPWLPCWLASRLATPFAKSMQAYRPIVGISESTIPGIESYTSALVKVLEAHLSKPSTPYLLGGRPCRGDFALSAPLWAHLYRDPHSRHLFDFAPNCCRWMESLHRGASGNSPLPPRPGGDGNAIFPAKDARDVAASGAFLPGDDVPHTLDWLFRTMFEEQWPFLRSLMDAVDGFLDANPDAQRLPRALGNAPMCIGGASGERRIVTFMQWKVQRPLEAFHELKADRRQSAEEWLQRVQGLQHMQHKPRHWLSRIVAGPMGEELRPVAAPCGSKVVATSRL